MTQLNIINKPKVSFRNREIEIATQMLAEKCDTFIVETDGIIHRHIAGVCFLKRNEMSSTEHAFRNKGI